MRYLIGIGILGAVAFAASRSKSKQAPRPIDGPDDLLLDGPCFDANLRPDDLELLRVTALDALSRAPEDLQGLDRVSWAASETMRKLCPQLPVPSEPYQIANYQAANGPGWAAAHDYALHIASGSDMPPPV